MDLPVEIISRSDKLEAAVKEIEKSGIIALDIESDSRHRYPEQLCLIQLATPRNVYIIDTLAVSDISPLRSVLFSRDIIKVFHEASGDIRSLDRHYGFRVRNIFDTAVAARFTGNARNGLENVIHGLLGISINKSKRLQRSDWGRRPLSDEALEYAATDVRHLIALREALIQRLKALGRETWVTEECDRLEDLRYEAPDPETFYHSIKGAGKLKGTALAVLRELYLFREGVARRRNKPPYYIIPDPALVYLAAHPGADLSQVPGLGGKILQRLGQGIREAIKEGLAAPPVYRESRRKTSQNREDVQQQPRLTRRQREKNLESLKEWRAKTGTSFSLESSLIWPLVSLARLSRNPDTLETELMSDDLRLWQKGRFSTSLAEFLESLR
ncbi:ribonuclease D [Chloroflexota bacterium]